MTMNKSVQKTISLIMCNEFQHFHTLWRFYASLVNFCIKGGYHLTSEGELDMGMSGLMDWVQSSFWSLYSCFLSCMSSCTAEAGTWFILSGSSPSASFLASFSSLFGALPSGTSFKEMSFLVHASFQGSFLKQKEFLLSQSFHFSWGRGGGYGLVHSEVMLL